MRGRFASTGCFASGWGELVARDKKQVWLPLLDPLVCAKKLCQNSLVDIHRVSDLASYMRMNRTVFFFLSF
jgi:hypothetical protein